jgi:hypothetical protein
VLVDFVIALRTGALVASPPTVLTVAVAACGCRLLFILGQLCKHGAAVLDAAAGETPGMASCAECLELCVA